MCGIVGYTGNKNCLPILIDGLKMLEYRGYDSAGVTFADEGKLCTVKECGRLEKLERKVAQLGKLTSHCGIGHTRWATHGAPSDINSHPHSASNLSLVHNGIIENYGEIEKSLELLGYSFVSDTDTERAAKLIDSIYKTCHDPVKSLFEAQTRLSGSYAFGIIFKDRADKIYALRRGSPLIVAKDASGAFLASDIPALLPYTRTYCRLDEGIVAELSPCGINFYNSHIELTEGIFEEAKWTEEQAKKGGFPHFMLKEIYEEPAVLAEAVGRRIKNGLPCFDVGFPPNELLSNIEHIKLVACGTAMHAGLIGKYIIERLAKISADVEIASEFRYRDPILSPHTLVILLSQSGETADTLAALRHSRVCGIPTLSIVNVFGSSLARESDFVIYTMAGPEISVASTKAYSVQCATLYLFAIQLALSKGVLAPFEAEKLCLSLQNELSASINDVLKLGERLSELAKSISQSEHLFYIGRGIDYYLALEASLKLKEISYIHSEAYAAGELKHGTISLITDKIPVIAIMTDPILAKKTESGICEVLSRGADVYCICSPMALSECNLPNDVSVICLPDSAQLLCPFLAATAVQLLAYHTSSSKGIDVDKPRNLAKSVTVE